VRSVTPIIILAIASICATAPAVAQAQGVALRHIAEQLGYDYAYMAQQDAVTLRRPGVAILLRPGETTFAVNDRTETTTRAPWFFRGDLYVSTVLADQLAEIATRYLRPQPARVAVREATVPGEATANPSGTISLDVRPLPGSEAIVASGTAPASAEIVLTLFGTESVDLPDVIVSRQRIASDSAGHFTAAIAIAPNYFRGSILTVVASLVAGSISARARLIVGAPNEGVSVPAEQLPRSFRL
jgi:hypothetical protein